MIKINKIEVTAECTVCHSEFSINEIESNPIDICPQCYSGSSFDRDALTMNVDATIIISPSVDNITATITFSPTL